VSSSPAALGQSHAKVKCHFSLVCSAMESLIFCSPFAEHLWFRGKVANGYRDICLVFDLRKLYFMPFSWSGDLEELTVKLLNKCFNVLLLLLLFLSINKVRCKKWKTRI